MTITVDTNPMPVRWEMPAEPGPEITEVWGRSGHRWDRDEHGWTRDDDWQHQLWPVPLLEDGPLTAIPPETAGGEPAPSPRHSDSGPGAP